MNYETFEDETRPRSSLLPGCLLGCLASVVFIVVLVGVGSWFAMKKGPGLLAQAVREGLVEGLKESDLPQDQQQRIIRQIDRIVEAVKNGEVSIEDFQSTATEIARSPLLGLIAVAALEAKYINASGLDDVEKAEAEVAIRRVMRGVLDEKIELDDLEEAMAVIAEKTGEDSWQLKNKISDEELRDFIAKCTATADTAEVEIDPEPVDIADEIRKLVDKLLGEDTGHSVPAEPTEL